MLSEREARDILERGRVTPTPFRLDVVNDKGPGAADFLIDLTWKKRTKGFVAEYKPLATPKMVETSIREAKNHAAVHPGRLPMIVVPYISEETAERLVEEEVSGLDLSGNVVVVVPGEWFVFLTGMPNQFPSSQSIKNVYQGKSSLVGRVLLTRPEYDLVKDVREEIKSRGGSISMGTVSKVLKALEADLIVHKNGGVRLIQPDRLLDRLARHYRRPEIMRRRVGKASLTTAFYESILRQAAGAGVRVAGRSESLYAIAPTTGAPTRRLCVATWRVAQRTSICGDGSIC